MSNFQKLLLIIKDTRQRLIDEEITQAEAQKILIEVERDYKAKCGASADVSIKELFSDLFESTDNTEGLNLLL